MTTIIKQMTVVFIVIIGITMLFSTAMQAQRMRITVEEQVKTLKDSLNLDDVQASKITKILEDQREEITNMRNEKQGDREAMRTAMLEIRNRMDEKIKAILNKDQLPKYEAMSKARRQRMEQRMREGNR